MSDEMPKQIIDVIGNSIAEAEVLFENAVSIAKAQERAEPTAFKEYLIVKALWEWLGEYLIDGHGITKLDLIGFIIDYSGDAPPTAPSEEKENEDES